MTVRTLCDTDSVQIVSNKWLDDVRQYQQNVDTLWKHGTINAALANIGTATQTTIVVTENTAVNVNTDLTSYPNISWRFLGAGKLTPATGVTLTLYSGDTIDCPPYQHCLDASSGTITFAKAGWVWPGWFGAIPGASASAGKTALQKLSAAFGSVGGAIWWPGYTIQADDTIAFTGPVRIHGLHPESSIFESTADASLKHGLTFTSSAQIENLTVKTATALTLNRSMHGLRFDMDGLTAAGQYYRLTNVKVRGFNAGVYADGGDAYNIDRATLEDVDIQTSGPDSSYIGSCLYLNRVTQLRGKNITLDQNNTGEHCLYFFGSKDVIIDGIKCRNATKSEAQAVKIVGNAVAPDDDQIYPAWSFRNLDIENCTNGVLAQIYGTEQLRNLQIENVAIKTLTGSATVTGAVHVEATGTSIVHAVMVNNLSIDTVGYQGLHCAAASGSRIGRIEFANVEAYNWSTASAGTYTLFGSNGTGVFNHIHLRNVYANGNSNGRTIVGVAGMSTTVSRATWDNLIEVNTTTPGRPISFTDADTTPSCALGNHFYVNNTGATSISRLDSVVKGQRYLLEFANANTTLTASARLLLAGASNFVSSSDDMMELLCTDDTAGATVMKQLSRSTN